MWIINGIITLSLMFASCAFAQDERFIRELYQDALRQTEEVKIAPKVLAESPVYKLDLNRDGLEEGIRTSVRDGLDYIQIDDYSGKTIFESSLSTVAKNSRIYKINLKTISKDTDALIVYFYEGQNEAVQFEGTARIYFITIDKRNLKTISIFKGPHFFHEFEKQRNQYGKRYYRVNVVDYNSDNIKEISVSYNKISRIYRYLENGKWAKF